MTLFGCECDTLRKRVKELEAELAKVKRRKKEVEPVHPVIEALRVGMGRYPDKQTWCVLIERAAGVRNLEGLTRSCCEWIASGWNKANFLGAIGYHLEKGTDRAPIDYDAIRRQQQEDIARGKYTHGSTKYAPESDEGPGAGVGGPPPLRVGHGAAGGLAEEDVSEPRVEPPGLPVQCGHDRVGGEAAAEVRGLHPGPLGVQPSGRTDRASKEELRGAIDSIFSALGGGA